MSRIIAIANEKGGVAKTTTAISLGGVLVERGQSVLLIDLDPQASLTVYLNISPYLVKTSVADIFLNGSPPVLLKTGINNLDLVPSNPDLVLAERFLAVRQDYKKILKNALQNIRKYDAIIIDCPPSLSAVTQNAFVAANLMIIPVIPEYLAVYTLRNLTKLIKSIRATENPQLSYRILFTMVDQRIKSHNTIKDRFREKFSNAIYNTEIQIDTRLRDASTAGFPITQYLPKTRSALQYRALANEIKELSGYERPKPEA